MAFSYLQGLILIKDWEVKKQVQLYFALGKSSE